MCAVREVQVGRESRRYGFWSILSRMDSRSRTIGAVGVLLMASAVALPWAKTGLAQAVDPVSGFGHGIEVVLILAGIGALALLLGNRLATFLTGCIAAVSTAYASYQLPGLLLAEAAGGIGIAQVSWGALLALTGSIALAWAALPRPRDSGMRTATPTA